MKKLISLLKKLKRHLPKLAVIIAIAGLSTAGVTYAQFARQTGSIGWGYGYGYGYGLGYGWDSGLSAGYRNVVTTSGSSSWSKLEQAEFTDGAAKYTDVAIAPDGTTYIAYSDMSYTGALTVEKYVNGAWTSIGTAIAGGASISEISIAFNNFGTPYVSFNNGGDLSVMYYTGGTSWSYASPSDITGAATVYVSDMTFDNTSNMPSVAYRDSTGGLYVATWDGAGDWTIIGGTFLTADSNSDTVSLAFDSNDVPYVAYAASPYGYTTIQKYSEGSWSVVGGTSISGSYSTFVDLVIDSNDNLYIATHDGASAVAVWTSTGGSWARISSPSTFDSNTQYPSITIDYEDNVYLAYTNTAFRLSVQKYSGSGTDWEYVASNISAQLPDHISLAASPDTSSIYVGYQDGVPLGGATVQVYESTESTSDASSYLYGYGYGYMNPNSTSGTEISWDPSITAFRVSSSAIGQPIVDAGILVPNSNDSSSATSAEFLFDVVALSDDLNSAVIFDGIILSASSSFDLADLNFTDLSSASISGQDFLGGFSFGNASEDLTSNEAITLYLNVGSQYDGETLNVYHLSPSASDWSILTTCEVGLETSGYCVFTATSFSSFAATTSTATEETGGGSDSGNSGSGGGGYPDGYFDDVVDQNTDPAPTEEIPYTQEPNTNPVTPTYSNNSNTGNIQTTETPQIGVNFPDDLIITSTSTEETSDITNPSQDKDVQINNSQCGKWCWFWIGWGSGAVFWLVVHLIFERRRNY